MRTPSNEIDGPPSGWSYRDKRTGILFRDNSLRAILSRVYIAWASNEIEIPENWQEVIKSEICEQHPDMPCREAGEEDVTFTFEDVVRFGTTIRNWIAQGRQFVPQEESERRARICAKCPQNKPIKVCLACNSATKWIAEKVGWPSTSIDHEIRGCAVCHCLLRYKVHMDLDVIENGDLQFPSWCWQAKQA